MSEKKGLFGRLFGVQKSSCCCGVEIEEIKDDEPSCCCGSTCSTDEKTTEGAEGKDGRLNIKILGPGCKNCVALEKNTKSAVEQMGLDVHIEKITDMAAIAGYGVMSTPGLVVNRKVVSFGKVLKPSDIIKILEKTL